mgnify:CR=1 FL=1
MKKNVTFVVDTDVYEKFCIALNLTNETQDAAVESCMRWYIAKTFEKVSQDYNPEAVTKDNEDVNKDFYGKANQRIPVWAVKPNQYNHKIIRAYFKAVAARWGEILHKCSKRSGNYRLLIDRKKYNIH